MNDTIIEFLKNNPSARISFRGECWVTWSAKHDRWGVFAHRGNDDDPADLVYLTDDMNEALNKLYGAARMPALSRSEVTA